MGGPTLNSELSEQAWRILQNIDPPASVVLAQPQMWNATHALASRDAAGSVVGVGSAFVVSFSRNDLDKKRCYVVTATHNLHGSTGRGGVSTTIMIRRRPHTPSEAAHEWPTVEVPITGEWYDGGDDVSVAMLPIESLPEDLFMFTVGRDDFLGTKPIAVLVASDVDLYGRWGVRPDRSHVVLRRGILASYERPRVRLDITPETETFAHVYIVDANVSKGMSGGLAVVSNGLGVNQQAVLGMIHGTQRLLEDDLRDLPVDDESRRQRERLIREMEIINGRMVYIVPYESVTSALDAFDERHRNGT